MDMDNKASSRLSDVFILVPAALAAQYLPRLCGGRGLPPLPCGECHIAIQYFARPCTRRRIYTILPPQPGDWAFGAGLQAITPVTRVAPDSYREDGLTWYRSLSMVMPLLPWDQHDEKGASSFALLTRLRAIPDLLRLPFHRSAVTREARRDHPPRTRRALRSLPWTGRRARPRRGPQSPAHSGAIERQRHESLLRTVPPD